MTKFNNEYFIRIVDAIVKKGGAFAGRRISTKKQLYALIGEQVHQSPETVRGWRKLRSSGPDPRNPELLKDLEKCLGLKEGDLLTQTGEYKIKDIVKKVDNMGNITDFQKIQVMECYEAMKKFVSNMDIEDEEKYYELRNTIETKKIVLPGIVYKKLCDFLDDTVEAYVFDDYTPEFTPEEAEYNKDGVLVIKSEDASNKIITFFVKKLMDLDAEIECFAEKELKPYLWA